VSTNGTSATSGRSPEHEALRRALALKSALLQLWDAIQRYDQPLEGEQTPGDARMRQVAMVEAKTLALPALARLVSDLDERLNQTERLRIVAKEAKEAREAQ
jgi:hypothetical protein